MSFPANTEKIPPNLKRAGVQRYDRLARRSIVFLLSEIVTGTWNRKGSDELWFVYCLSKGSLVQNCRNQTSLFLFLVLAKSLIGAEIICFTLLTIAEELRQRS